MDDKEWVQCDRCKKWRGLKREDFKAIVENETWYCSQNPDLEYSTCETPQEMTDSEIDAIYRKRELKATVAKSLMFPAIWQEIPSNVYTYKRRKSIKEEDIAICQCRPNSGGSCLENCINRILNIECTPGFCPCEGSCRNQRFFLRQHASVEIRCAGDKGFGLFSKTLIKEGEFVTEYMGEILDETEYLRRRTFYAESGQKHYYFMQIGNGEVIDACRMGNAGRFMNHSCDPNCETQKWLVKGDLRVGFFTTRTVQAGEELTFNYNFQTEKPIRCFCGSINCTGSIGRQKTLRKDSSHPEEVPEASKEALVLPPPIMVRGEEIDEVLESFLAQQVGVFDGPIINGDQIKQRLKTLYKTHGHLNLAESLEVEDLSKTHFPSSRGLLVDQPVSSSSGDLSEKQQRSKDLTRSVSRKRLRGRGGRSSCSSSSLERYPSTSGPKTTRSTRGAYQKQTSSTQKYRLDPERRRSEVDLSLDDITTESGKLYNPSRRNIVKVLRLFNLIEIGKTEKERLEAEQARQKLEQTRKVPGLLKAPSEPFVIGGYCMDPGQKEDAPSARQRSHFADLSLLLDVVLNTIDPTARGLFIEFGILSQLQQVIGRNFAPQYSVLLRKILRVIDCLPLKQSDFERTRSSHGTMGHLIIALTHHKDNGVRNIALAIARQNSLISESESGVQGTGGGWFNRQRFNVQETGGFYPTRPNDRRPEGLGKRHCGMTADPQLTFYGQDYLTSTNTGFVQPPPPPPYPDLGKSQVGDNEDPGLEVQAEDVSFPPGFGCASRPHLGFREQQQQQHFNDNLRNSQFSKSRQFRHDSPSLRPPSQGLKQSPLGRIIRPVQTCSQPKQKEGLFSNELGKTMEFAQKAHNEILAKEAKEVEEDRNKRQKLNEDQEVVGVSGGSEKASGTELEGWDHLNQDFKEFVSQTLRRRIQKYQQPEHPLKLRCDEAEALFKKLYTSIICIEENAFGTFARDKIKRHVSKSKLELNIKEYTRKTMHQFYDSRMLL